MAEFEIDGQLYRTVKMNGRAQFHLLRKTGTMAGIFARFASMDMPPDMAMRNLTVLVAFWQEFSKLTQEQADDLLSHCLMYTQRVVGGNGAGPAIGAPMFQGRDMYEDTDIMVLMRICVEVIRENLGGFFPTASEPATSGPLPSAPETQPTHPS